MSFMFHPYPYADPRAVNPVDPACLGCDVVRGGLSIARKLAEVARAGARRVALDGYAGARFDELRNLLAAQLGANAEIVPTESLLKSPEAIRAMIAPLLPDDRALDPVLLYGVRIERDYADFFDPDKLAALQKRLREASGVIAVVGQGALCAALLPLYDLRVWADITPRQAALNFKYGRARNLGEPTALPFSAMMRRNYYVDFELAVALRWQLIREGQLDWYISADDPANAAMLPYQAVCALFDALRRKPFRCRPVYLEGVWGGFYLKRLRHLPDAMRNCAWIFDMIPMEVSLVAKLPDGEFEAPFFTFVQQQGEKLLGGAAFQAFGGYFPIRFNYDDTFHASGNMSIQCHPDAKYVMRNHGELGRQDESYYVCVAGEGACTYLGFREEGSCAAFLKAAEHAQATGETIDYKRYVNAVPSQSGTQVMIPAGTIHASGQNQVILEIGSLTVGSYTYKLYDYQRLDPQTGLPRPIHLEAGKRVLHPERTAPWVAENLVNHGGVVREGAGYSETVIGEHDLLYFSLRSLRFDCAISDDTAGLFHVLSLTEGERVRVRSEADPTRFFDAEYLDIVVVPADFGAYVIENLGVGPVTVHKTMLKPDFERAVDFGKAADARG